MGVARAAQAYTPGAQYETLRDFGFGAPTGVELPGEVGGTLRRPDQWSDNSAVSLAIGYEISVTPLQMALAYGALANGGMLLEPWLVAEVLDVDGVLLEQRRPRTVRRVIPTRVARQLAGVLEDVVEYGTATAARARDLPRGGQDRNDQSPRRRATTWRDATTPPSWGSSPPTIRSWSCS